MVLLGLVCVGFWVGFGVSVLWVLWVWIWDTLAAACLLGLWCQAGNDLGFGLLRFGLGYQ